MRLCLPKAGGERREPLTLPRPTQGPEKPEAGEESSASGQPHTPTSPLQKDGTLHAFQSPSGHTLKKTN